MINLCLFDQDGTLTDPKAGITKAFRYSLRSFGIEVSNLDDLEKFIGPPLRDSFREYYSFSEAEAETAISKYREYYADIGIFENGLYDGIIPMLQRLKDNGITLAIATSKPTVFAERVAEHFKIRHYFKLIAGSELDGTRDRKSEVIQYALRIIDPGREKSVVMIGDRKHDIIGAREAGIDSIAITWGYGSRKELEEAKAERMADSPEELCQMVLDKI